jgi:septum formation protein
MPPTIYLASQSPRRQSLLSQMGQGFVLLLPDPSEDVESLESTQAGESPLDYVQRVTALKLRAALDRWRLRGLSLAPILCADTTVALGSEILGKPQDRQQARDMLRALSGKTHSVLTAIAAATPLEERHAISVSQVRFAAWRHSDLEAYLDAGEWEGKAGAYAIQGRAAAHIAHMEGSYSGVMGLPVYETSTLLKPLWKGLG